MTEYKPTIEEIETTRRVIDYFETCQFRGWYRVGVDELVRQIWKYRAALKNPQGEK